MPTDVIVIRRISFVCPEWYYCSNSDICLKLFHQLNSTENLQGKTIFSPVAKAQFCMACNRWVVQLTLQTLMPVVFLLQLSCFCKEKPHKIQFSFKRTSMKIISRATQSYLAVCENRSQGDSMDSHGEITEWHESVLHWLQHLVGNQLNSLNRPVLRYQRQLPQRRAKNRANCNVA